MTIDQLKSEISKLKISDKLLLIEGVWDSIAEFNSELPVAEWQRLELDKRDQEYQRGALELYDADQVHDSLREKYK